MEAPLDLYNLVRLNFPEITAKADREYIRLWGELDSEFAYSWFGSLANALNAEMCKGTNYESHTKLFIFISNSLEIAQKRFITALMFRLLKTCSGRSQAKKQLPTGTPCLNHSKNFI